MTAERETVVVTGLGVTTSLGGDVASTWAAMLEGRCGVRLLTEPWAEELPVRIAAQAVADPAESVGRVQARRMDRCEQFALVAAREAWADAGAPELDPERLGVTVTSGVGGIGSTLAAYDTLKEKGWQRISPYTVPMLMPNGSAGWISMEMGAKAGAHSLVSACASGAEAIGYGIDMIRSGRADVVIAGGTEAAIMALNIGAFAVMRAMSTRNDEPERASRPFDAARDGYSSDAHHIAHPAPDGAGVAAAISRALADAEVDPAQVVHVNAHATSTPEGDALEAQALVKALGSATDGVVVTSTKSMTGHLLGGAGAIESVAAVLALHNHLAPPTINLDDLDEDVPVDVATEPRPLAKRGSEPMAVLNNALGFGGHNVSLVFTVHCCLTERLSLSAGLFRVAGRRAGRRVRLWRRPGPGRRRRACARCC